MRICAGLLWSLLIPVTTLLALSSHDCAVRLAESTADQRQASCGGEPLCGDFPESPPDISFKDRLSPKCAALLRTYRSPWPRRGITAPSVARANLARRVCPLATSGNAGSPVVVSSNTSATFVMCTVPKIGSTNTRKLLSTVISDPDPIPLDAFEQTQRAHQFEYPNVGHFRVRADASTGTPPQLRRSLQADGDAASGDSAKLWQPTPTARTPLQGGSGTQAWSPTGYKPPGTVPEDVPTFTIGRNPYVRLLSGYRNKMVVRAGQHDQWTRKYVNQELGVPEDTDWDDTAAGFSAFVRAMSTMPRFAAINSHFRSSVRVCSGAAGFVYDYYLRLEDLQAWLPCWVHALSLDKYTDRGWAQVGRARTYVGDSDVEQLVTFRWERTGFTERPVWDADEGRVTLGEEGRDWRWMKGDGCWWKPHDMSCEEYYARAEGQDGRVVPGADVGGEMTNAHASATGSGWEQYYDQATADKVFQLYKTDFDAFRYERLIVQPE